MHQHTRPAPPPPLRRCYDLLDLAKTVTQFQKLERVEIGGNKGGTLTTYVESVYSDFQTELARWKESDYDVLDVSNKDRFADNFRIFRCKVKELEQRLGGILNMGFDDCGTVFSAFKLIDSFGELLERDFIQSDLEAKHLSLIRWYGDDLKEVQELFSSDQHKSAQGKFFARDGPPLYMNMPPVSGALAWVQGLLQRMSEPMSSLQARPPGHLPRRRSRTRGAPASTRAPRRPRTTSHPPAHTHARAQRTRGRRW